MELCHVANSFLLVGLQQKNIAIGRLGVDGDNVKDWGDIATT